MSKLINISEATSIAIHSLSVIAQSTEMINANQLAEITGFSKNHLAKVLQLLVKQNYIKSVRGPKGGFVMSVDASKISLLEVFEYFDGVVDTEYCSNHKEICPFENCEMNDIVQDLSRQFVNRMKAKTVADIKIHVRK